MMHILKVIDAVDLVILGEEGYESNETINDFIDTLVQCKNKKSYFVYKPYVLEYCDSFTLMVDDDLVYNVFVKQVDLFEELEFNLHRDN